MVLSYRLLSLWEAMAYTVTTIEEEVVVGCILRVANPVGEQGAHNCMSPKYHVNFTSFNCSAKVPQALFSKTENTTKFSFHHRGDSTS